MFKPVLNSQDDLDELLSNAAKELDVNGIRSLAEKYRSVSSTHIDALVDFPHNSHLMFHLIVLIFLQNNLTSSSLNILDVGVGGGENI